MLKKYSFNKYYFSLLTSLFISFLGHLVKNVDEIYQINCGGICFLKNTSSILFSFESILNSLIVFLICFFIIQIRMERLFFKRIKAIYDDLEFSADSVISTSRVVSDMDALIENVGQFTKMKRAEIELLKRDEEFRREFLGNIAHELKTPLFTVQGYILTLLDGAVKDNAVSKKYLSRANKGVERLIYLVKDLDFLTNLEQGNIRLELDNFDIVVLINNVFEMMEIRLKKSNVTLEFDKDYNEPILVYGDYERIQQVLTNLIVNSIKYGIQGGKTEVRIQSFDKEKLIIRVKDNGEGIEDENLPRLFERFFRIDKSGNRKKGGSGLGLSIVKHIIEAHGEQIFVESQLNVGSEFSFTLSKARI